MKLGLHHEEPQSLVPWGVSVEIVQQGVMGRAWICGLGTGLDGDSS